MKTNLNILFIISYFSLLTFDFSPELYATIRYVSKTGSSTPPYTNWATAADSIQKCINICEDGDTIYVANGVYYESLVVNKILTLIGSSMDSTIVDGSNSTNQSVIYVDRSISFNQKFLFKSSKLCYRLPNRSGLFRIHG